MATPNTPLTPAEQMLFDDPNIKSTPVIYQAGCYICEDSDYGTMGLPLCYRCKACNSHVAADEDVCVTCGEVQS